jgi:formate-dependent phosphoribosylglycinamide formyltransferase (GAR transformylase)
MDRNKSSIPEHVRAQLFALGLPAAQVAMPGKGASAAIQDQALSRGFESLRAAGDTGWVSGTAQSKDFVEYEMKVNAAIGATKIAAVCTYRAAVTADEFVAFVTAHQDALEQASM